MTKLLIIVAGMTVGVAVYTRSAGFGIQSTNEFEYTTAEETGVFTGAPPVRDSNPVIKTYFRRVDGVSGLIIRETRKGRTASTVRYNLPDRNASVTVQVDGGVKTTYPVTAAQSRAWLSSPAVTDCKGSYMNARFVGTSVLAGVAVQKLYENNPTEEADFYVAPSLGCATLQEDHKWKNAEGAFTSWTNVELMSLRLGPPDTKYFGLDANALEVPPSQARAIVRSVLYRDETMPECWRKTNDRLDAIYQRQLERAASNRASVR